MVSRQLELLNVLLVLKFLLLVLLGAELLYLDFWTGSEPAELLASSRVGLASFVSHSFGLHFWDLGVFSIDLLSIVLSSVDDK